MPAVGAVQLREPAGGETFVKRKITHGLARKGEYLEDFLYMDNLDSLRDLGHARQYVEMFWRMLQQLGTSENLLVATGRQELVIRFIELAALELCWGSLQEKGYGTQVVGRRGDGEMVVRIDSGYFAQPKLIVC